MSDYPLSIIIPIKNVDAAALAVLQGLAQSSPSLVIVAVGRVSVANPGYPNNLRVIDCDCPIYDAMNIGARGADSDYLLFMGIDDCLLAANVDEVIAGLHGVHGAALVVLPFRVGARLVGQRPIPGRLSSFHHQGVLFLRQALLDAGGYGAKYRLHSDLDLMFRMQRAGSVKALAVPLVSFTKGGMSTSGRHAITSMREFSTIYGEHRVSRLSLSFAFSMSLLAWYRMRWLLRRLLLGRAMAPPIS